MDAYEKGHMVTEALVLAELIDDEEITQKAAVDRLYEFTEGGLSKTEANEVISGYLELYRFGLASGFLGKS